MPKRRKQRFYIPDKGVPPGITRWFENQLELFKDGYVDVQIGRPTRSRDQNSYLWGVVYPTVARGYHDNGQTHLNIMVPGGEAVRLPITVDTLHFIYKHRFIPIIAPDKEISTTALDTTEMHEYIEMIRWDEDVQAAGIYVPEPNEEEALNL